MFASSEELFFRPNDVFLKFFAFSLFAWQVISPKRYRSSWKSPICDRILPSCYPLAFEPLERTLFGERVFMTS
jgi:hypothetical protein